MVAIAAAAGLCGCSLLVSTSGLSGGTADAEDAGDAADVIMGSDARTEPDAEPVADGGLDAPVSVGNIAWVQRSELSDTTPGSTVKTPPFAVPPKAGNTIICYLDYASATGSVTSFTDSGGNPYAKAVGPVRSAGWSDELWYSIGIQSTANISPQATFSDAYSPRNISCHEYSGIGSFDQATMELFPSAGAHSTMPVITTSPVELIFSSFTTTGQATPGPGLSQKSNIDGDLIMDRIVTTAGTYSAEATCTAACTSTAAYFKAQ